MVDERLLHGVQVVALGQALDGRDPQTRRRHGEGKTGEVAFAIDVDGAGAALPLVAALL